jgi:hypothetical protein
MVVYFSVLLFPITHSTPGGQLRTRQHAKIRKTNLPRRRSPWIVVAIAALLLVGSIDPPGARDQQPGLLSAGAALTSNHTFNVRNRVLRLIPKMVISSLTGSPCR